MARDPDKAALWADADVYVAPVNTAIPADIDADFSASWQMVGLLDGDAGFVTSRSQDQTDFAAWGVGVIKTSRKNFKATVKFTVLEDNAVTRSLIWPDSTYDEIVVPQPTPIMVAFELREGDKKKRLITRNYATVDVDGDFTEGEADLTKYPLVATIVPDGDGVLFDRQAQDAAGINES